MAEHEAPGSPSRQRRLLPPPVEPMREALAHHRAGRLDEARRLYEAILAEAPHYPPALNGLGLLRLTDGEPEAARELLAHAATLRPDSARYRFNLGSALEALGRNDAAAKAYRAAFRLKPDSRAGGRQPRPAAASPGARRCGNRLAKKGDGPAAAECHCAQRPWKPVHAARRGQ